jgi:hypothetical protein
MMPPATLSSSSEVIASPLMVAKSVTAVSFGLHDAFALAGHYLFRPDLFEGQVTQSSQVRRVPFEGLLNELCRRAIV